MSDLPEPVLYGLLGLGGLLVLALIWAGTRPLPAVGRWLARAVILLAIAVPVVMSQFMPVGHAPPTSIGAERPAAAPDADVVRRRAEDTLRQVAEEAERKRAQESAARTAEATRQSSEREAARIQPRMMAPPAAAPVPAPQPSEPAAGGAPPPGATGSDDGATTATRGPASSTAAAEGNEAWDVVPVYYGTDRNRERDADKGIVYGSERAGRLELGRALVTVPKTHQQPQIERPYVYRLPFTNVVIYSEPEDPTKHFTLRQVQAMDEGQFLAVVQERLRNSKEFKDHALVFVHGFNTNFDFAIYRIAQIAYDMTFDGAPFAYSWPSKGGVLNYGFDRESAEQARRHLREFLDLVVKKSGAKKISIIAHSMGNYVLMPALEQLKDSMPEGVKLSQVILASPDVDRGQFTALAQSIRALSDGMTLYAHGADRALQVSKRVWGTARAGDITADGPLIVEGVDTIDATAVSMAVLDLNHSGYAESKALLTDIQRLIREGIRPPGVRTPGLEAITTPTGSYWKYNSGR